MGKQGPCYHCGVTSTPLWRNGPPDKPVLCNACGSRWRTKGTLVNYTPLHARPESDEYEDHRVVRVKSISLNKTKDPTKVLKRKHGHDNISNSTMMMVVGGVGGREFPSEYSSQGFRKVMDEEASNRSSSGSAISNSESCAQFGSGDASDLTGPAQSIVWDSMVPSRKRTCVNRPKHSSVEKLTKDLYTILQEQQSSYFSGSSDDLLFESETPMVSVEMGHGSVLIRHPNAIVKEEESEASSLSVDNKRSHSNETYSHAGANFVGNGNVKMKLSGNVIQQEPIRREKSYHEIFQLLGSHNSPLCHVDLSDIIKSEEFTRHLTKEEQHKLLKYLPMSDATKFPESLESLFDSPQFKENLNSFQQLLAGGLFDMSFSDGKPEDRKALKKLVLSNLSKSKWVEHHRFLKNSKTSSRASVVSGPNVKALGNLTNTKRPHDSQNKKFPDVKIVIKSPKRVIVKSGYEKKEATENDGACFSPRSLFALPTDGGSFLLDPINFVEESSDQDLLLNVPSNGSFAQAELLHPALSFGSQQASTSSSSVHPRLVRP